MRALSGNANISPAVLNNARYIRYDYEPELSCKHVFVGNRGTSHEILEDSLKLANPEVAQNYLLSPIWARKPT